MRAEADVTANGSTVPCSNCGCAITGRYCPACGQKRDINSTLIGLVEGLFHSITHVDSKFWRTLPLLALHPGILTRDYITGKRTRYVSPGTLFLASAFLMFLSFNVVGIKPLVAPCHSPSAEAALSDFEGRVKTGLTDWTSSSGRGPIAGAIAAGIRTSMDWFDRHAPGTMRKALGQAANNPQLTLLQVRQKAYKMGFLLVPLSLPALWFLFGRLPGVGSYDLAIFSLYSIAFMSITMTVAMILAAIERVPWQVSAAILCVVPPVHMFRHVKECFDLTIQSALLRTASLVGIAMLTLGGFLLFILMLGIR